MRSGSNIFLIQKLLKNYNLLILSFIIKNAISSQFNTFLYRETYNLTNLDYFRCEDSNINCSGAGLCTEDKDECNCFEGYTTVFPKSEDFFSMKARCNYQQKKATYAVALALFPSFGFLHFYLGHRLIGYIQMIFFSITTFMNFGVVISLSMKHIKRVNQVEYRQTLSLSLVNCFLSLICLFWYLFDFFMVLFEVYKDDNGVNLLTFSNILN
jgi:hypothetical protein